MRADKDKIKKMEENGRKYGIDVDKLLKKYRAYRVKAIRLMRLTGDNDEYNNIKIIMDKALKSVREDRRCAICMNTIHKGKESCLTGTVMSNGVRHRVWVCKRCSVQVVSSLVELVHELEQAYDAQEPDWDDGKSSNGL